MKNFFQKITHFLFAGDNNVSVSHIREVKNLKGKTVLVRVDFNVPIGEDRRVDENEAWRIDRALPTIDFLKNAGARIVLISHIGRDPNESLRPVAEYINNQLNIKIGFVPQVVGKVAKETIKRMGEGQIILLENLRSDERETKNDMSFAKELAGYGDIYVNDAFSNGHRNHASMVSLPKLLPHYAGFQFAEEIKHLESALHPDHPLLLIVGGAKFETKLPLIKKMLPIADTLFVGGALAHTFLKYKGFEIGRSLFEENVAVKSMVSQKNILLPVDVLVDGDAGPRTIDVENVNADDQIVDLGEKSLQALQEKIKEAHTVVWNGPLGYYEKGFDTGTKKLMELLGESSAQSILGGGDTVLVARKYDLIDKITFVSTAGGAMLDFLVEGTLPAIKALQLPQ